MIEYLFGNISSALLDSTRKAAAGIFGEDCFPHDLITMHIRWGDKRKLDTHFLLYYVFHNVFQSQMYLFFRDNDALSILELPFREMTLIPLKDYIDALNNTVTTNNIKQPKIFLTTEDPKAYADVKKVRLILIFKLKLD